jgi:hypothetical protein
VEEAILEGWCPVVSSRERSDRETVRVHPSSCPSNPARDPEEAGMVARGGQRQSVAREGGENARGERSGLTAALV